MFVYALDAGRRSVRVVMAVDSSAPEVVEGRVFPRTADPACILDQLRIWKDTYGACPGPMVLSQQDYVPSELLKALEDHGFAVERVSESELQEVQRIWGRLGVDPRWRRAGWMTFLINAQRLYGVGGKNPYQVALNWLYAFLRSQVSEIEARLWAEGQLQCPGHLSPYCPDCEDFLSWPGEHEEHEYSFNSAENG